MTSLMSLSFSPRHTSLHTYSIKSQQICPTENILPLFTIHFLRIRPLFSLMDYHFLLVIFCVVFSWTRAIRKLSRSHALTMDISVCLSASFRRPLVALAGVLLFRKKRSLFKRSVEKKIVSTASMCNQWNGR